MTDKVLSFSRARKQRARDDARKLADANAAKHGQTKADRVLLATREAGARKSLDQHKLEEE